MANLKTFVNISDDRIKSAIGVPVDRTKDILGSLLNQNEPEVDGYLEKVTTELSKADIVDMNTFVRSLKQGLGITKLDEKFYFLYPLAGDTDANSLINLAKDAHHATAINAPIFTQYEGFTGIIANSTHIKTGFVPSTHAPDSLNDMAFGVYVMIPDATPSFSKGHGVWDNSGRLLDIIPLGTSSLMLSRTNEGTGTNTTRGVFRQYGLKSGMRNGENKSNCASDYELYGVSGTGVSVGLPQIEVTLLGRNKKGTIDNKSESQISFAYCSKYLNQIQHDNLFGAMNEYLFNKGKHLESILFYRHIQLTNDATKYQGFGNIAKDSEGRLYVVYRTEDENIHGYSASGKVVMRVSTNGGVSWGDENTVADETDIDDRNCGILIFNNNGIETILVSYNATPSDGSYVYAIRKSLVSNPYVFSDKIIAGAEGSRANPILLSNGKILAPTNRSVLESTDGGENWTNYIIADAESKSVSEATIIECKTDGTYQGKVIAIFRTGAPQNNLISYSSDYGHTWTNLAYLDFAHNVNSQLFRYDANTLFLFIGGVDAVDAPSGGILVYKSTDEGDTWDLWKAFANNMVRGNHHPSVVALDNNHFAYNWCNNTTGSNVHIYDLIIDPATV